MTCSPNGRHSGQFCLRPFAKQRDETKLIRNPRLCQYPKVGIIEWLWIPDQFSFAFLADARNAKRKLSGMTQVESVA